MNDWSTEEYAVPVAEAHAERYESIGTMGSVVGFALVCVTIWALFFAPFAVTTWGGDTPGRDALFPSLLAGTVTVLLGALAVAYYRNWRAGQLIKGVIIQARIDWPDDDAAGKYGVDHVLKPGDELDVLLIVDPRESMRIETVEVLLEATESEAGEDDESGETVTSLGGELEEGRNLKLVKGEEKRFETTLAVPLDAPVSVHREDRELYWMLTARIVFTDGREWYLKEPLFVE